MPKKPQASSGPTFLITTENACWRQETSNWNTLGQQEETTLSDLFFKLFDEFFHVCGTCMWQCKYVCLSGLLWRSEGTVDAFCHHSLPYSLDTGVLVEQELAMLASWLASEYHLHPPTLGLQTRGALDAGDLNSCLHDCRTSSYLHWSIYLSSPKCLSL